MKKSLFLILMAAAASGAKTTCSAIDVPKKEVRKKLNILLKKGVNAKDEKGTTPLHYAVLLGDTKVVASLLSQGANPNAKMEGGYTPLHFAVLVGDTHTVRKLIECGSDPNAEAEERRTPLLIALALKNKPISKILLENGAKHPVTLMIERYPEKIRAIKNQIKNKS